MSQSQVVYNRKKRKHNELPKFADGEEEFDKAEGDDRSKKKKGDLHNLHILNQIRLNARMGKKFNTGGNMNFLSEEQLMFAKKVAEGGNVDQNTAIQNNNIKDNNDDKQVEVNLKFAMSKLQLTQTNTFSVFAQKKNTSLNFELSSEALSFIGLLTSCDYTIKANSKQELIIEISIEKNENEKMIFQIKFDKTIENNNYVDYVPLITTFKFQDEDELAFYEELEIHKQDLGKMMKRFLNYKLDE